MVSLLDIKPNKVSRDYSGYPVVFLGETGDGKTGSINKFLKSVAPEGKVPLFFAFEDATMAVEGIYAVRIYSYSDLLTYVSQLNNPKAKEMYSCVVFDTADKFEKMMKSVIENAKEVDIIEDIGFSKGKKYLQSKTSIVTQLRNMGYPVHFTAQLYKTVDFKTNATVYKVKLDEATTREMFHDAFLIGRVSPDRKSKNPITDDRLITFRKTEECPDLKDKFGLAPSMHVADIKGELDKVFSSRYGEDMTTAESLTTEIKEDKTFDEVVSEGMEYGNILANNGKLAEAMYVLKTELGVDENDNPKTLNDLNPAQIEVAKVVTVKLADLVHKYNLK